MPILTVAQYRTISQTPGTPPSDEDIQLALDRYTALIEGYTGRSFTFSSRCETHYPGPNSQIQLNVYPVTELLSLSVDDIDTDIASSTLHRAAGLIHPATSSGFSGRKVVVAYTAGYQDAPYEIKIALATLVEGYLAGTSGGVNELAPMKKEAVMGVASVEYGNSGQDYSMFGTPYAELGSYVSVLERYREPGLC